MKKIIFFILSLSVSTSNAALIGASGKVEKLTFATTDSGWEEVLVLEGVDSLNSCGKGFRFKRDEDYSRGYSIALSAYIAGKTIEVKVNENDQNPSGDCYIKLITLQN